jgi:hypothetical protein
LAFAAYRHVHYDLSLLPPDNNDSWTIEARLFFNANNRPVKVHFNLPRDNKNFSIIDEQFITQNFSTSITQDEKTNNRMAVFEKKKASGQQVLLYRVTVELDKTEEEKSVAADKTKAEIHSVENVLQPAKYAKKPTIAAINHYKLNRAVLNLITKARKESTDNRQLVANAIALLKDKDNKLTKEIYAQLEPDTSSYMLLEYVLHQAQIPYNKTHGFTINKDNKSYPFREWIDVYLDGEWVEIGADGVLNNNENPEQFRWWNGDIPIMKVEGGENADIDIYYKENFGSQTAKEIEKGAPNNLEWLKFPFAKLPIATQTAIEVLLLMPIGALIISIGRQIIGVDTFGTFMPILLAIAFRDIAPMWSLIMFACIITVGLTARAVIDDLQLLMVPKLSVIMTAIIIGIMAFSLIAREIDITSTISIGLLPIVILSMLIERITVNWDEHGYKDTLMSGVGSLFVTFACWLVLNQDEVSHLIFNFPELLLVVLSAILLVGRYRGFKLLEIMRFKYFLRENN